jgi:hypothetical protein
MEVAGSPAAVQGSMPWETDKVLQERLAALNTSGRHITNLTRINGTTYAEIEVGSRLRVARRAAAAP